MSTSDITSTTSRIRLQRYLAHCGIASRRACEQLIAAGRVRVNGALVQQQGMVIAPDTDRVEVDGLWVRPQQRVYVAAYKPRGCLCTASDPQGRRTIFDVLRGSPNFPTGRLFTVGRLDYASEGLLLLTNDGAWSQRVAHPRNHVRKVYRVWLSKVLSRSELARLRRGITTPAGDTLKFISIRPMHVAGEGTFYEIVLTEGHNRHIRRMFEAMDISVRRLLRVRIGTIQLGTLPPGRWRHLTSREVRSLI